MLTLSLLLTLVPFGLIIWGIQQGISEFWWAGITLFMIGGVIPFMSRYIFKDEEESKEEENGVTEDGA